VGPALATDPNAIAYVRGLVGFASVIFLPVSARWFGEAREWFATRREARAAKRE